jgi:predicted O-methyltransferase YrrM
MNTDYVLDASYPDTFFQELSPAWLNYARAVNGVPARPLDRAFTYLELGAGLGHSTVVNAAAFPRGEFHACDFNPFHVASGRAYAKALGLPNIQFHESSFQRLLDRDLPMFDFIVLHGVYSWVGAEARAAIRRIVSEKLAPDGLVYVSYNCMPGWASEMPVRRLMVELAAAATGDSAAKMHYATQVLQKLGDSKLRFFENHPEAARAIESYGKVPASYLAHEFLNETWEPFYSVDVADEMADAQLVFVGSATLADNHPMLVIDDAAVEVMRTLATSPRQLHLATDFASNRRFRRDLFIRADTPRSQADAARALNEAIIGSVGDPQSIALKVKVPRGQITFQPDFVDELRSLLSGGSVMLGDAVAQLGGNRRNTAEIARNLVFLVAGGALAPFAKIYRHSLPTEVRRPANSVVERSLACIIEERAPRAIPSELLGNGVLVKPDEALAIVDLLSGDNPNALTAYPPGVIEHVTRHLLPALARLQLVI